MNQPNPGNSGQQNKAQQSTEVKEPTTTVNQFLPSGMANLGLDADQSVRMECLKIAALALSGSQTTTRTDATINMAKRLEHYVKTGVIQAEIEGV